MVALKSYYRQEKYLQLGWTGRYKNKTYSTSHLKYWTLMRDRMGITAENLDTCVPENKEFKYTVNKSFCKRPMKHSEYNFYTDGSKMGEGVGSGFVLYKVCLLYTSPSPRD